MTLIEFLGVFAVIANNALTNAGGAGGGVILPFVIIFFGFTTLEAVAIANAVIFIAAVVRFIYQFKEKHPQKNAVLCNYDAVMCMIPVGFLGSYLGVEINDVMPPAIIVILAPLLLLYLAITTFRKARGFYMAETELKITLAAETTAMLLEQVSRDRTRYKSVKDSLIE